MAIRDCRAYCSIATGAVSGMPLSKGGSGAYTMWSWMRLCGLIAAQLRREAQRSIDSGCYACGEDAGAVDHHTFVDRDRAKVRQQVQRCPVRRSPASVEQARRATEQGACAHGKNAARPCRLPAEPAQHLRVVHQGFLAGTAWNMQDIQRRCIGQRSVRRKSQAFQIPNRRCRLAVDTIGRVRNARQHLERPSQVDLIDAFEEQGADVQVGIMRESSSSPGLRSVMDKAKLPGHGLSEMPKSPRSLPNAVRVIDVLTYPAVQLLDVTGPVQVFASANDIVVNAGGARPYLLKVVAQGGERVTASAGVALAAGPLTQRG